MLNIDTVNSNLFIGYFEGLTYTLLMNKFELTVPDLYLCTVLSIPYATIICSNRGKVNKKTSGLYTDEQTSQIYSKLRVTDQYIEIMSSWNKF